MGIPATTRWACAECDVLVTARFRPACWSCRRPMTPGDKYRSPCSVGSLHPMLAHVEVVYPGEDP